MTWGIPDRLGMSGGWRRWLPAERRAALSAELGPWERVRPTLGATGRQGGATLDAELGAVWIVSLAAWAAHGEPSSTAMQAAGVRAANVSMRATDISVCDEVSVLQVRPGVKRKAPDGGSG